MNENYNIRRVTEGDEQILAYIQTESWKAAFQKILEPQEVGLWAEFQNYSRSEMDLAPLPDKWDYKGSRIWINDREILPWLGRGPG